uniref:Genome polyprotein n=1 Tax=Bovine boosepivirus TaxID=3145025 RepID=A0AAU6W601_9PICO
MSTYKTNQIEAIEVYRSTYINESKHCITVIRITNDVGHIVLKKTVKFKSTVKNGLHSFRGVSSSRVSSGNRSDAITAEGQTVSITNINYYGSNYAAAKGEAELSMDPGKFTKPVTDLLAGPALKSPSVEECGYSDRVMQLTAGNSTITTQEAVQAVVAYGKWPEYSPGPGNAVDNPSRPGPAVQRFYTMDSVEWTKTWPGVGYKLPGCLTDLGLFGTNCRYHFLMNSGYCVHVQCNATKFHQGMLLVVAIPEMQYQKGDSGLGKVFDVEENMYKQYPLYQLTLFPHQMINLRTNNSATLILPYVSANPSENAFTHDIWSVLVIPICPLDYAGNATTTIPVTVTFAPMESSFSGLRGNNVLQGVPTFQIPGSGQFVTTLRNSGYPLIPHFPESTGHEIPGEVRNLMEVAQVDTFCKIGDSGQLYFNVAPGKREEPIKQWDMSFLSDTFSTTYLARLVKFYSQYRGTVNLTLTFAGPALATGKLLISYTPPGTDPPRTRTDAMLGTHVIWDIGLQSTVKFSIPYISQTQYRFANQQRTTLSYAGYLSIFYQTGIVVPPNVQNYCPITLMCSAGDDFVMRVATDNAYYQGLGDETGKIITQAVKEKLESVVTDAVSGKGLPQQLSVQVGDAAALTASETGVSSSAAASTLMETREISETFSRAETDINNFMSRYAKFHSEILNMNNGGNSMIKVPLYFNQDVTTQRAVRAKYRMFTYLRCHYDVVIVLQNSEVARANGLITTSPQPYSFQVLFSPAGSPQPTNWESPEWAMPTMPQVFFKSNEPYCSFRIPFISPSQAYCAFYDGYTDFNPETARYGEFPGNYVGDLFVRSLSKYSTQDGTAGKWKMIFMARPVDIKVWCPRPIVSLKETAFVDATTRHRVLCVDEETTEQIHIGQGPYGSDLRIQRGRRSRKGFTRTTLRTPYFMPNLPNVRQVLDHDNEFHAIPIQSNIWLIPYHLFSVCMEYKMAGEWTPLKWEMIKMDVTHDAILIKVDAECHPVKIAEMQDRMITTCRTVNYNYSIKFRHPTIANRITVEATDEIPEHYQYNLIQCEEDIPPGWCGSPLYHEGGVVGMATAGGNGMADFTYISKIPWIAQYMKSAEQQGPVEWAKSMVSELGSAFGASVVDSANQTIRHAVADMQQIDTSVPVKTIVALLVKVICAMVLIARSEDRTVTATAVGIMLGIDILTTSPFTWLKNKVRDMLGVAHKQGLTDWIKEFNAACTALRGLDWIGEKILKFIEWLKKIFKKEDPDRKKFMKQLDELPDLMQKFDEVRKDKSKFPPDYINSLCENFRVLKKGADKFGIERNFATTQILQYYVMAIQMQQAISRSRAEPIAILIHGGPGSGKSLATEVLGRRISQYFQCERPYSLPPDPKHFDGYTGQPVTIMDDVGQNPDGEDLKMFCQMVSTTEFHVPMASLEDKGKPFTSHFVLCSTNMNELRPPTVAEPAALKRRFYLDLDIELQDKFKKSGKLMAFEALEQCSDVHVSHFRKCCPFIDGKAVLFKERGTNIRYSIDGLFKMLITEHESRMACNNKVDALFQGGDEWEDLEFVHNLKVHKPIEPKPMPAEIMDLLRANPKEEIIQWCADQGYLLPPKETIELTRSKVRIIVNDIAVGLTIISSLIGIATALYFVFKAFASKQGAYETDMVKAPLKKPIKRIVVEQGPLDEFSASVMKRSLFKTKTEKGSFSGLGLFDKYILLPRHATPTSKVCLDGKEYNVLEQIDLNNTSGQLELSVLQIDRPVNFRDVRKFLPTHFSSTKAKLLVNSDRFPELVLDVGRVTMHGFLNLSFKPVYNTCTYLYPTKVGQCGGVCVSEGKIVAMHIGGDGVNGYGAILTANMFSKIQGHIVEERPARAKVNLPTKTKLHPSIYYDVFEGSKQPSVLHEKDPRLSRYVDFDKTLFSKYKNAEKQMKPTDHMLVAVKHYADQVRPIIPPNVTEPLSLDEVVYGIENLEGLDLDTSAGYPYVTMGKTKKDLIPPRGESLTKLQQALDLHGTNLPFVTYLKDELRPEEKVKFGKTRMIECSSLNDTIRMKRIMGRLFQTYHANPGTITGSAVGCDPDVDWSRFFAEMAPNPLVAFDYSNYDGSLHPVWFECLKLFLKELGYGPEAEECVNYICNSVHIYKDKEFNVEGGMPSGCSGTSVFNSIINNIIIRTLILDVYKQIDLDHLRVIAYGDDIIASYPFPLEAAHLAEAGSDYGLVMTPPDKTSEFKQIEWDEVTFLKRKFKPDDRYPFLIHPVFPMGEIYESIRWTKSAANLQNHVTSLCHLAWHNGKVIYDEFVGKLRSRPIGRLLNIPSYEVLEQKWLDKF